MVTMFGSFADGVRQGVGVVAVDAGAGESAGYCEGIEHADLSPEYHVP